MSGFLSMGGYAAFVWPAYGISIFGLLAAIVWAIAAYRRAQARLRILENGAP